jgi:hypothetical protein
MSETRQLTLIEDAAELVERYNLGELFSVDGDGDDSLYDWKLDEAFDNGLYDDIAAHGVAKPVVIVPRGFNTDWFGALPYDLVGNGNHRLAAAAHLGQYVPVVWSARTFDGISPEYTATRDTWEDEQGNFWSDDEWSDDDGDLDDDSSWPSVAESDDLHLVAA